MKLKSTSWLASLNKKQSCCSRAQLYGWTVGEKCYEQVKSGTNLPNPKIHFFNWTGLVMMLLLKRKSVIFGSENGWHPADCQGTANFMRTFLQEFFLSENSALPDYQSCDTGLGYRRQFNGLNINYRWLPSTRLYGTALPTLDGQLNKPVKNEKEKFVLEHSPVPQKMQA